uniref:Secreted protein n=1 Tax=Panagrolaimus sp. PS1159 TaxID=55785 RepID=A0AC35F2P2_9BILA
MSSHIIAIILFITIALTLAKPQQQIHAGSETPKTVVEKTEVGLVEVPKTEPEGAGVQSGGDGWPIPEGTVHEP